MESAILNSNNTKGFQAILNGKAGNVKINKRRFEFTVQEKMSYECCILYNSWYDAIQLFLIFHEFLAFQMFI